MPIFLENEVHPWSKGSSSRFQLPLSKTNYGNNKKKNILAFGGAFISNKLLEDLREGKANELI